MSPEEAGDRAEYVAARAVLLDALEALRPHQAAVVLAGAQAVYLLTGPGALPIAEFTTDGDLALDPALLTEAPPLEDLMSAAGFRLAELQGASEPGIWEKAVDIDGVEAPVAVDLIVPAGAAPPGGTRGARLAGHGKRAARKTIGLEAALVDNEVMPSTPSTRPTAASPGFGSPAWRPSLSQRPTRSATGSRADDRIG